MISWYLNKLLDLVHFLDELLDESGLAYQILRITMRQYTLYKNYNMGSGKYIAGDERYQALYGK